MAKRIITFLLAAVMLACGVITFSACVPRNKTIYNEFGGFYEIQDNDTISVKYLVAVSSLFYNQMIVDFKNVNIVFTFSSDRVIFANSTKNINGNTVQMEYGDVIVFGFAENQIDKTIPSYISVIVVIVGYGLLKADYDAPLGEEWKVIKYARISQKEEQEQAITEQMIEDAIQAVISESEQDDEIGPNDENAENPDIFYYPTAGFQIYVNSEYKDKFLEKQFIREDYDWDNLLDIQYGLWNNTNNRGTMNIELKEEGLSNLQAAIAHFRELEFVESVISPKIKAYSPSVNANDRFYVYVDASCKQDYTNESLTSNKFDYANIQSFDYRRWATTQFGEEYGVLIITISDAESADLSEVMAHFKNLDFVIKVAYYNTIMTI